MFPVRRFLPSAAVSAACAALMLVVACSGPQKAVDKMIIKGSVGRKYSEMMSRSGFKIRNDYGKLLVSERLSDNTLLHIHVCPYESSSSTWFGLFGSVNYSYKVNGFKVKDDVVQDWAYALYAPEEHASHIFGIEYGYDKKAIIARIRNDYPNLMKTSTDELVAVWKK